MKMTPIIHDDKERLYWTDIEYEMRDIEILTLRLLHLCEHLDLTKDNVDIYIDSFKEVSSLLDQKTHDMRYDLYGLQSFFHPNLDVPIVYRQNVS